MEQICCNIFYIISDLFFFFENFFSTQSLSHHHKTTMLSLNIHFSRINWNLSDKSRLSVLWRVGRVNISNSEIVRKPNIWRLLTLEVTQLIKYWPQSWSVTQATHRVISADCSVHIWVSATWELGSHTRRWQPGDKMTPGSLYCLETNYTGEAAADISVWRIARPRLTIFTSQLETIITRLSWLGIWK